MASINRKIAKLKSQQNLKKNVKTAGVDNKKSLLQVLHSRYQEQIKRDSDSLFDVKRLDKAKSINTKIQEQKAQSEKTFMMKFLKG